MGRLVAHSASRRFRVFVRIADVYDALRAERPYKSAWTEDQALTEIRRVRGLHLDPELTDLFLDLRGW